MIAVHIITGVLLMGLGFIVKKHPELIAGYNTMPKARKEKFDIAGYALLMKRSFIAVGLLIIALGIINEIALWSDGFIFFTLLPVLALVLFLNISARRYG